ncbi:MAG: 1-acyl-sn-glycerol-3-phosphate acyltransferase [Oscillospiraceae bacterium]|nr:1-acyl-sn-glycerol-3-phosphate acyltransferase [Oscillospiraceae bacterium]
MLLGFLFTVPAVCALLICFFTGVFQSLAWLWALPVSYLGSFLVTGVLVFLFVIICEHAVDTDKPQEKDSKFYRFLVNCIAEAAIPILSVKMHTKGLEKTPKEGRFLLVCNHLNEMDPVVLLRYFKDSQLAFISKRENQSMFVVGKYMHKIQCQLMNRENDREALKTILKCVEIIKEDKASIAVFPEGYIKPDRKLHHFRSGVFKIAQRTKVPIVVCTLRNTQYVFHNGKRLKPTDVYLNLVDVIQPEAYAGMSTVDLGNMVYEMMAQDLGPENVSNEE